MGVLKGLLLRTLIVIAVLWTVRVFRDVSEEVGRRQAKHPDKYPQNADLLEAGGIFVALLISQLLFRRFFDMIAKAMIPKKTRWSHEVYGAKLSRCCDAFFKFGFYLGMTVWGFLLLRGQPFTPWPLGGSGDTRVCWTDNFPFQAVNEGLRHFYLAHMGYHLSELAMLFMEKQHPDFWEMLLHGTLACSLTVLSYGLNYLRIGSLVLLLHGGTDIFIYASKAFVDTPYTRITGVSYFALVASYAWLRIFVFPLYVMKSAWVESIEEVKSEQVYGWGFLNFALSALLLLHMYWFCLIVKIGFYFGQTGHAKDLQSNLSAMELVGKKGPLKAA